MVDAYQWGLKVLELANALKDFFLYKPFYDILKYYQFGNILYLNDEWASPFLRRGDTPSWLIEIIANASVGEIIFSASVVGILIFKVAKFFIGIFTGS